MSSWGRAGRSSRQQSPDDLARVVLVDAGQVGVGVETFQEQRVLAGVGGEQADRAVSRPRPQREMLVPGLTVRPRELEGRGRAVAPRHRQHERALAEPCEGVVDRQLPAARGGVDEPGQAAQPTVAVGPAGCRGATGERPREGVGDPSAASGPSALRHPGSLTRRPARHRPDSGRPAQRPRPALPARPLGPARPARLLTPSGSVAPGRPARPAQLGSAAPAARPVLT